MLLQQQCLRSGESRIGLEPLTAANHLEITFRDLIAIEFSPAINGHCIFRQIPGQKTPPRILMEHWQRQMSLADEVAGLHRESFTDPQ